MSGNAIEVRVILQPWGFVVVESIVARLYFISADPSGMSGGPLEHHLSRRASRRQLRPQTIRAISLCGDL